MLQNGNHKLIALILFLALIINLGLTFSSAESTLSVNAKAAALYEPATQTFLYSKNADERLPMASTTKIMTALVAIERENLNREISVDERAVGVEGSSAYLKAGEIFTLRELLYALMLQSANDAAEAIAYAISGNVEGFAELMNEKALSLGLTNTNFTNPHGLDCEEHYTTAHDLAIITAEAMSYPEFSEIVSTSVKRVEKEGISRLFANHNKLLKLYDGCIGVKTGFTKKSGRCLVSAAERDGLQLISVTLDCPDDWNEHKKMLDFGYGQMERVILLSQEDFEYTLPVLNAEQNSVRLGISEDLFVIKRKDEQMPNFQIELPRFLGAPILYGDKVGKIVVKSGEKILLECDVVALEAINVKKKEGFFSFLF